MDTTQTNEGTSSDSINSENDYYDLTNKLNFLHKFTIVFCIVGVIVSLFYIVCALPRPLPVKVAYWMNDSIRYPLDFALIGHRSWNWRSNMSYSIGFICVISD